jgi:tetratricopeptide (TPR) repeat protein
VSKSTSRGIFTYVCAALLGSSVLSTVGCQQDSGAFADNSRKQGIKLYKDGNYADAAGSFQNAVRQDARDYESWYYLGVSYDALKSYQQSIQAFRSALDTMNTTMEGRRNKAFRAKVIDGLAITIAKSNTRQIETDAIRARANGRETAEDFLILAKVNRYSQDADAAIEAYNRAVLLEPNNYPITKEYGLYLDQLGQAQKAEPLLRRAYQMNAKDEDVIAALRRIGVIPGPSLLDKDYANSTVPTKTANVRE